MFFISIYLSINAHILSLPLLQSHHIILHPPSPPTPRSFEEGFLLEHGHFPRGVERAALASTYAQYRAWKRLVREDAARCVLRRCAVLQCNAMQCKSHATPFS